MDAPRPFQEQRRLQVLRQYQILDTPPEPCFDEIISQVARQCNVQMAVFSLVDEHRVWFKSRIGIDDSETDRAATFCAYVVAMDAPLVVEDTLKDERFSESPMVVGEPHYRFYAGVPIHAITGEPIGTLCVMDCVEHSFPWDDYLFLKRQALRIEAELESRRRMSTH